MHSWRDSANIMHFRAMQLVIQLSDDMNLACYFPLVIIDQKRRSRQSKSMGMRTEEHSVGQDIAQAVEHSDIKVWILLYGRLILHICSLDSFPFQLVVHNRPIKGWGMCCSVCGKMHIQDPLVLIEKGSLCGDNGIPLEICHNDHMLDVQ